MAVEKPSGGSGHWVTVNGRHLFIGTGSSVAEALKGSEHPPEEKGAKPTKPPTVQSVKKVLGTVGGELSDMSGRTAVMVPGASYSYGHVASASRGFKVTKNMFGGHIDVVWKSGGGYSEMAGKKASETAGKVKQKLKELGYEVRDGVAPTSFSVHHPKQ